MITIYVDCFSETSNKKNIAQYSDADFIVITHNDWDHYESSYVAKVAAISGAVIIGPPSIAYPLLTEYNIKKEKLYILYTTQPENPIDTLINQVFFKVYQSTHFNNWFPVHLSYFISVQGKKLSERRFI